MLFVVTVFFEFTALYFLLVHLLERSADGLRLAASTVGIDTLFGRELGPQCLISCYPDCKPTEVSYTRQQISFCPL